MLIFSQSIFIGLIGMNRWGEGHRKIIFIRFNLIQAVSLKNCGAYLIGMWSQLLKALLLAQSLILACFSWYY
jgi:hypothetical protein